MNRAIPIGNIGKDPEIRIAKEKKVATFTLATQESKDSTTWHNIVAREKNAELIEKYVRKGDKISIEGRISNRTYDDKDGNKRYISEIVADRIELIGARRESAEQTPAVNSTAAENISNNTPPVDDLPF